MESNDRDRCDGVGLAPDVPGAASEFSLARLMPEAKLWLAVLRDAVAQAARGRAEALAWIKDEADFVGSFEFICAHLKLEPGPLRRALLNGRAVRARKMTRIAA